MPVFERTYRAFEGDIEPRFRWAIVVKQELKMLIKVKMFLAFVLFGLVHVIARVLQVVAYDVVIEDPNNPLAGALKQIEMIVVGPSMFFDFIRIQAPLVLFASLLAGAGMICNDFRNNLMEIYFSKPITWVDYGLGKLMTLILIGLMFTAFPALLLIGLHNSLAPSWDTFTETMGWAVASVGYSLIIVMPCALGVLASSALLKSENFAGAAVFMVLMADSAMGGILAELLKERSYLAISLPLSINRIGEIMFDYRKPLFEMAWPLPFAFVCGVSLWAAWVVFRCVRRAEMAA